MFLIYFISYGCNDSALVFLGGAEASASPSFMESQMGQNSPGFHRRVIIKTPFS